MVRVKICGITRLDDALAASEYGADAIGFVFYGKSPRYIEPYAARDIVGKIPPFITPVALFVNETEAKVREILNITGINVIQFHGDEQPDYVRLFNQRVIKAFRIADDSSLEGVHEYDVNALLFDAFRADTYGGTGRTFNWELIKGKRFDEKVIIAGGLTPENVSEAIMKVRPYGVDVSSGVEVSPGVKDHKKMREFILRVKESAEN